MNARLFTAINFSSDTRSRLFGLLDKLRSRSARGNFTHIENLHLTLVFIGDCDPKQTAAVKAVMDETAFEPFDVIIGRVGKFTRGTGDIWWAGAAETSSLINLQSRLTDGLARAGFVVDKRRYSPHITLGREVVSDAEPWEIEPFGETARKVDLMRSERVGGKLTYTSVYRRGRQSKKIAVEPYNNRWPGEFEKIKDYLMPFIGDSVVEIHHVGSTSVAGLAAKPIIDIDIEIPAGNFSEIKKRLEAIGFIHEGDLGITGREVFKRENLDGFTAHHLYVCPSGGDELMRHLKFRDRLRLDPAAAKEYGALKISLAAKHGDDIDAYTAGKTDFINGILEL